MSEIAVQPTVLDVGAEQLGKIYARALLAATEAEGSTDQVIAELDRLCDEGLAQNPSLRLAFESPRIDLQEKCRVIDRLFGDAHPTLVRFLKVMARRDRLGYVAAVRDSVSWLHDEMTGRLLAKVTTAVPLTDSLRGEITNRLSDRFGKSVRLRESVDDSLIGGMVVRVGDTVFDSSVASRLDKIGKAAATGFARHLIENSNLFTSS